MSEFKRGDRVKVEYESEILHVFDDEAHVRHPAGPQFSYIYVPLSALTKIPDPAPTWQLGDVVAIGTHVMRRADNEPNARWWCTCGGRHNDAQVETDWRNGDVEVLRHRDSS